MITHVFHRISRALLSSGLAMIALGVALLLLAGCAQQPKSTDDQFSTVTQPVPASLAGKFYSLDDPYNTLELTADGHYTLTEGSHEVKGQWRVDGEKFILIGPTGKEADGRVTGGRIVDPSGGQWVRY